MECLVGLARFLGERDPFLDGGYMLDRETPEVRRRVGEFARQARADRRELIKFTTWLNAGGVGPTLTFAGTLIGAGRPGYFAVAPFLLFALGLLSIGVLLAAEYSTSIGTVIENVPRLGRRLLRRRLRVRLLDMSIRLQDSRRSMRTAGVCGLMLAQAFFLVGVLASALVLLAV